MQLIPNHRGLDSGLKLTLVTSVEDARQLMEWIKQPRQVLGVDTETGGLDYWRDELRLVQVGDTTHGWSIPFPEWGGLAREVINGYDRPIAMHNAKFDVHFLEHAGFVIDRTQTHDTRVLAHLLDNDVTTGLKPLSARHIDRRADSLEQQLKTVMKENKWKWSTIPTDHPAYWQYGALDPVMTAAIFEITEPEVSASFRDAYDIEMAAQWVLADMETRGIRVDIPYTQELALRIWDHLDHLDQLAMDRWKISLGSNDQVAEVLLNDNVQLVKRTSTGKFAMDEEVLEAIPHELATMVLTHRGLTKIANTYLKNFIDLSDDDGFLHPSLNLLGAKTGRMSVSRPSLQNLERTADVRNSFIAREGHKLLLIDYDQIEMRLFAHYSESESLLQAFSGQGDVDGFTQMAREIYNDPSITKDDPRRQTTKNAGYAKIYGAGIDTFAGTAGITSAQAAHFMAVFDRTYPEVPEFLTKVEAEARGRLTTDGIGSVTTFYGDRRLVLHNDRKLYKLVNFLIQGTAAQVLKERMVELDHEGLTEHLVLPVHDELVFDVPEEHAVELGQRIQTAMTVTDTFDVPLTTELKFVDRWGDAYPPGKAMKALDHGI